MLTSPSSDTVSFIATALEHTFYVAPRDLGLTPEELVEVGRRHNIGEGELRDALQLAQHSHVSLTWPQGRYRLKPMMLHGLGTFFIPMNPDYRDPKAFDFVARMFDELRREVGLAAARLPWSVVVERAAHAGLNRLTVEATLAILVATGQLSEPADGSLASGGPLSANPSHQAVSTRDIRMPVDPLRERLHATVRDVVARRTDGRPAHSEPLDAFGERLTELGYAPFRIWWAQMVAELRRSDEFHNSVATCVLAAALVEGSLTFTVKHGRSLNVGLFGSTDFDAKPHKWKIENLVKSAASSGGPLAILDEHSRHRADELIRTRQRIHAGRMLDDHPTGLPDINPDQARDAKRTAEAIVRRILDWLQAHPVPR